MGYNLNYNTGASIASGLLGGVLIFFVIVMIICLIVGVCAIIGQWKVLKKANKPGWGALIPFYNTYLFCQMTGVSPWWIVAVIFASLLSFIPIIGGLITMAVSIYFGVLLSVSIARSFGKEDVFAIGLILLAPVFYMILGLDDSKYLGAKPMDDVVLNYIKKVTGKTDQK